MYPVPQLQRQLSFDTCHITVSWVFIHTGTWARALSQRSQLWHVILILDSGAPSAVHIRVSTIRVSIIRVSTISTAGYRLICMPAHRNRNRTRQRASIGFPGFEPHCISAAIAAPFLLLRIPGRPGVLQIPSSRERVRWQDIRMESIGQVFVLKIFQSTFRNTATIPPPCS